MAVNARAQLKALITEAIRKSPATPVFETAQKVGLSSGLCRAVWAVLDVDQRNALVRQAEKEARRVRS